MSFPSNSDCPCCSGQTYAQCCAPLHHGEKKAQTAEQLMRSRYCAYVLHLPKYLHRTWHPANRPARSSLERDDQIEWLGLEIIETVDGMAENKTGVVEFIASYREGVQNGKIHERSTFKRTGKGWLYEKGVQIS